MRRHLPKLTVRRRLILLCAALAILLPAFLYLQNWPTLTAEGALRRVERQYLSAPGEIVARGRLSLRARDDSAQATHWLVTQGADGRYAVAVLDHFWGILWRPARHGSYHIPDQYPTADEALQWISVSLNVLTSAPGDWADISTALVFSHDPAVTRVTLTQAALPREVTHDPVPHIEAGGVTAECVQVAPGVWLGEVTFPFITGSTGGSSAPWTILRGYDAAGTLICEVLPDPA